MKLRPEKTRHWQNHEHETNRIIIMTTKTISLSTHHSIIKPKETYLCDADTIDPLVQGPHVITTKVFDVLRFLLDLWVLQD